MNTEKLRASILQSAIKGKIVSQLPEEPIPDVDEISIDEEIPFSIPDKWKWVHLKTVCDYIQRGKSPKYSNIQKYPVVAQKCNQWDGFHIEKAKFIEPDSLASYAKERILQDGDVLLNSTGIGTLGRAAIYESKLNPYELAVADGHVTVIRTNKEKLNPKFLYYYFRSPAVQNSIESRGGGSTKQKELNLKTVKYYEVPLPPLLEQNRIVSKVESLLPLIESYGKAYNRLQQINSELPNQLKASILQDAISGKLITQLPDNPTIKQTTNSSKNFPFEIPTGWKWAQLKTIGKIVGGGTPKTSVPEYWENGNIPWITPADLGSKPLKYIESGSRFITNKGLQNSSAKLLPKGSIVYSSRAPIGYIAITAQQLCTNQGCKSFIPDPKYISTKWAYYTLIARTKDIQSRASGTTFKEISGKGMGETWIPLPPISEQEKIVNKIESILILVDKLKF